MSKKKIALIINIIIFILEMFVFIKSIFIDKDLSLAYYTNDSNIIALISSLLFIIFYKKDFELVKDIRFVATSCLTVTFLVVIFILCPMYNFNYKLFMFTDNFLILHTIAPILSIVSYIAFEERSSKNYLCLIFTIVYGVILIGLNILTLIEGPYPFLMIRNQSPLMTLLWGAIIIGGSYVIGLGLNYLNKKIKGATK
jgi:hypothetical protein